MDKNVNTFQPQKYFNSGKFFRQPERKNRSRKNFFPVLSISSLIESELIARLRRGLEEVIAVGDDGY